MTGIKKMNKIGGRKKARRALTRKVWVEHKKRKKKMVKKRIKEGQLHLEKEINQYISNVCGWIAISP